MNIQWDFLGGGCIAELDTSKHKIRTIVTRNEEGYKVRTWTLYSPDELTGSGRDLQAQKTCNSLIEALHWAEDEMKFLKKEKVSK